MGEIIDLRRGFAAAASLSVIAGLLAACSPGPSEPAPVYLRNAGPTAARKPPSPVRDNTMFTVSHGDTVIEIAHAYRVPLGALIAANRLSSPYLIHPGDRLLIPDGGVPPPGSIPSVEVATASPPATAATPPQMAAAAPLPASTQIAATPLQPAPAQVAAAVPPKAPAAVAPTQLASTAPLPPAPPQIAAIASPPAAPTQPVTAQPRPATPPVTVAAAPLIPPVLPPSTAAAQPQPPSPAAKTTPATVATTPLAPPVLPPPTAGAPIQPPSPAPIAAKTTPTVVPLSPPPKQVAAAVPAPQPVAAAVSAPPPVTPVTTPAGLPSVLAARNPAAALPLPGEAAPVIPLQASSGRFLWPVHGRVLASYGSANGGPHNEGINIAAPLGTPVRTVDAGTVAYVGNEVKGYGNLVLVRHANGWISAYAHLEDVTVKKGDTVAAGEVIAKVGDAGIGAPQLHFELRRGKKPVDPENFLDPAGSAAARPAQKAG